MSISDPSKGNSAAMQLFRDVANRLPSEADYATIGKIALHHTALEYQLEALVWFYMGDVDKGHVATARMGSRDRIEVLTTLVEWTEPDDGIAESIVWATKCFDVLRNNRNSIIHGFNFKADKSSGRLFIERRVRNELIFGEFEQFEISPEDLHKVTAEQRRLAQFLWEIARILECRGEAEIGPNLPPPDAPAPLPPKFPLPEKLSPIPRQSANSSRRQRAASQQTEAKKAKDDRKNAQRAAQGHSEKKN